MSDRHPSNSGFSRWRRWSIGGQVVAAALALGAIVVMVNYLSARHHARYHWSDSSQQALSPLTRQLLVSLTNEVAVTVFYDPAESSLFSEVRTLIEEYTSVTDQIRVEYVDYGKNPGRTDFLLSQYGITSSTDTLLVVFDTDARAPRIVREKELSDYDFSGALRGEPVRRVGFKGEQFFTSALLTLIEGRPIRAYAVMGHGEANIDNEDAPDGYSDFVGLLAGKNIQVKPLVLRTNGVPSDCELLLIGGPRYRIPPDELEALDRYLQSGGRALILLLSAARPGVRSSGLEGLLSRWGVRVLEGLVLDEMQSQAGDARVLLTGRFGEHPVVRPLQGARLGLIMPAGVTMMVTPGREPEGAKVEPLAFTSESGSVVTPTGGGQGLVQTNGVIPVAVAVERGTIAGVTADRGSVRMVVVGEATFLSNQLFEFEANQDFGALAVNWLLDRQQLVQLGARPIHEYQLNLTSTQLHGAAWMLLGVLPGCALFLGLVVWLRRRR